MAFRLEFSVDAERDFGLIFDHLLRSHLDFGESLESALDRASARVREIRAGAERILTSPHRGERHDDLLPVLRHDDPALDGKRFIDHVAFTPDIRLHARRFFSRFSPTKALSSATTTASASKSMR